jgi:hypothetical protein
VLVALAMLDELQLPGLPEAVFRHRSDAHEGLLIPRLVDHGQVDGTSIEPMQLVRSVLDVGATMIDIGSLPDAEALPCSARSGASTIPACPRCWS